MNCHQPQPYIYWYSCWHWFKSCINQTLIPYYIRFWHIWSSSPFMLLYTPLIINKTKQRNRILQTSASDFSDSFFQVIAHHPMQSISFASGGDTVGVALYSYTILYVAVGISVLANSTYLTGLHFTGL